ncbi:magnesium transporter [Caulobacter sp. D4A]|uniref:magnesium transporter CorA family protein n=1 Tax=unclassified Caulobacter TaxID=2648921 RepID=UPI000D72EDA6|nr:MULTISPECIES: magnesium transporter CorA family protein [unclassified Caulobacter]PXA71133.1 magnesium transporter [Caulobacter sp. D4A]PXA91551.1 magnesium transporter [Caulobacter sp. D5]
MLRVLRQGAPGFEPGGHTPDWRLPSDAVWIELVDPTRAEEVAVEQSIGLLLPTREEMAEIEASSRLYQEDGGTFMTATILVNAEGELPTAAPVTFVLTGDKLVTIRYVEPRAFSVFTAQAERQPSLCPGGPQTFLGLLDAVIDRTADILERTASEVETQSRMIFGRPRGAAFEKILERLGRAQIVNAKARDSLVSLARLLSFASLAEQFEGDRELRDHLKSLQRDVTSITDHSSYLSGNITFLLDAALGFINIEQNQIFKIFSVFSAVFLPPTLIAGIYGMNFEHMPELRWLEGYPIALGLMLAAALIPLMWFRRKGWL